MRPILEQGRPRFDESALWSALQRSFSPGARKELSEFKIFGGMGSATKTWISSAAQSLDMSPELLLEAIGKDVPDYVLGALSGGPITKPVGPWLNGVYAHARDIESRGMEKKWQKLEGIVKKHKEGFASPQELRIALSYAKELGFASTEIQIAKALKDVA